MIIQKYGVLAKMVQPRIADDFASINENLKKLQKPISEKCTGSFTISSKGLFLNGEYLKPEEYDTAIRYYEIGNTNSLPGKIILRWLEDKQITLDHGQKIKLYYDGTYVFI